MAFVKFMSWPSFAIVSLHVISLLVLTLILICPTPFQHNSISLLTIAPQTIKTASNLVNVTDATAIAGQASTSTASRAPISTATTSHNVTSTQQAVANLDVSTLNKRLALPITNSTFGSTNVSVTTANYGTSANSTVSSDILLRLGPLGSCFRTSVGQETCSTAKLSGMYDYTSLQAAIDQAASSGGTAISVASVLPNQRSFFGVALLIVLSVVGAMTAVNVAHLVALVELAKAEDEHTSANSDNKRSSNARSSLSMLSTVPWLAVASTSKWVSVACSVAIFISAGVQKYTISNAVSTFNGASPVTYAPAGYKGNDGNATNSETITLVADTASGFGFAWSAAIALFISFWIQRTFVRRQKALIDARNELQLRRSASMLSSRHSPPAYHSRGRLASQDELLATLPSLRKAHEGNARLDESRDVPAPFATYQSPPMCSSTIRGATRGSTDVEDNRAAFRTYPPPAPSRFAVSRIQPHVDTMEQLSQCLCSSNGGAGSHQRQHQHSLSHADGEVHVIQDQHPSSVRSVSPAPSYWTGEWRTGAMHGTGEIDRERERHFMAELRRKRSAAALNS